MNPLSNLLALVLLVTVPTAVVVAGIVTLAALDDSRNSSTHGAYQVPYYFQERGALQFDESIGGPVISIGGRTFPRGLGTHANSEIRIEWNEPAAVLTGYCGLDDAARGRGSVVFKIASDKRLLYESPVTRGGSAHRFEVPVEGLNGLDLIVEDADDGIDADFASWAELELQAGGQGR